MKEIEYYSNNSGGRDWLTDENWLTLRDAGWKIRTFGGDSRRYEYANKPFPSMKDAILEFERLLDIYASDEGCTCCGPPHEFIDNGNRQFVSGHEVIDVLGIEDRDEIIERLKR